MSKNTSKFVASFSGGKDSMLAIWRAIKQGMVPLELITTYNIDAKVSWFHGVPDELLMKIRDSIGIPINLVRTSGDEYAANFENALKKAKECGAEVCVFGDIDLEVHRTWCTDRCDAAGIEAYFPLWNESRESLVYEFIDSGFKAIIKVVDNKKLSPEFIGSLLTRETVNKIKESGADMCGENGEYHTFVYDGPLFKEPVNYKINDAMIFENYTLLDINI
ncbi:Dph6-related ATP pyrophosphatase [Acetivibrio cellulolyticus]|uniref:Dph6-related ATP pyrophosphatase n=1 Tax=Acetivibrio cellulolyticus TaxID=35830 RepID=UPI0001E2E376|nr:diphthine--ammonia ligase [Acetivibrio cellulolyticus]